MSIRNQVTATDSLSCKYDQCEQQTDRVNDRNCAICRNENWNCHLNVSYVRRNKKCFFTRNILTGVFFRARARPKREMETVFLFFIVIICKYFHVRVKI